MHGLGNDYVYVDCFKQEITQPEALAIKISDRHFGVGSDGLILVCPSTVADVRMRMFNADGSEGMMCGNGIRCVAKFSYERGLSLQNPMRVETASGIKILALTIKDSIVTEVKVDMGEPKLDAGLIPVLSNTPQALSIAEVDLEFCCVSMGNPHAITFVPELSDALVLAKGPIVEKHKLFPKRINVGFIQVVDKQNIKMRVFERGSGETLACGTGACASVVAGVLKNKIDRTCAVELLGGTLQIEWAENNHVFMTGPATEVFRGEFMI